MASDLATPLTVEIVLLGEHPKSVSATLSVIDGARLTLLAATCFPVNSPVKVLFEDRLWLGEVLESRPNGEMSVYATHSLKDLNALTSLADRFLGSRRAGDAEPARLPSPTLS